MKPCENNKQLDQKQDALQFDNICITNDSLLNGNNRMPFTIHNSRFKLPSAVANPIAVMWNNTLIVLAMENKRLRRIVFIKVSESEEWIQRKTGGEVPGDRFYTEHTAQVIEDKIYLFVRQFYGFRAIYCLDLNSWTWALSNTDAPDISGGGGLLPSWVFKEKMYHYSDHRLFCYDVSKNFWEVPSLKGQLPPDLGLGFAVIDENTVFFFDRTDGLFILDMDTMFWTKVHGDPRKLLRITHCHLTLTKVSHSTAVLIGQSGNSMVCWLLHLQKAKQLLEPSSMWTRIMLPLPMISNYATVFEPKGQELQLIGGRHFAAISSSVMKIRTRFPSLKSLATDCAARSTCTSDLSQLPICIRNEILVCKQEMIGVESICTQEEGCMKCQTPR